MTNQTNLGLIWANTGGVTDPGDTKYSTGWIAEIPTYQNFNFVLQTSTKNILVKAEQGYYEWQGDINYKAGVEVREGGKTYFCILDNLNQQPSLDTTNSYWIPGKVMGDTVPGSGSVGKGVLTKDSTKHTTGLWLGNDSTIESKQPTIALTSDGATNNWLLVNIAGKMCLVDVGVAGTPDGRNISIGQSGVYEIYHEGHKPDQTEVSGTIPAAPADGKLYARAGGNWVRVTSTSVQSSPPPPLLGAGQGWYNLDDGQHYIDIDDGDSSQWVPANPPAIPAIPAGGPINDYNFESPNRFEYQYVVAEEVLNGFVLTGQSLAEGGVGGDTVSPSLSPYQDNIQMLASHPIGLNTDVLGTSFVQLQEGGRVTISSSYLRDINVEGDRLMHGQAWGGKEYSAIKKGGSTGVYEKIITQANNSFSNNPFLVYKGLQVIHGEADGLINNTNYEANLVEWFTDFNNDLAGVTGQLTTIPMLLCQVGSSAGYGKVGGITSDEFPTQLAQYEAHLNNADIYLVAPKYQLEYADHSHITNQAQALLGEYYAKAFNSIQNTGTYEPLNPNTITGAGSTVTVTFNGRVGNLTLDTTNVNPIANSGFEYVDDSGNTITGVSIVGDTVEITLSGVIGLNPRLAYAYNNGTDTSATGQTAGNGARGNLRDSDPTPSKYGSTPLYNWCVIFRENVVT